MTKPKPEERDDTLRKLEQLLATQKTMKPKEHSAFQSLLEQLKNTPTGKSTSLALQKAIRNVLLSQIAAKQKTYLAAVAALGPRLAAGDVKAANTARALKAALSMLGETSKSVTSGSSRQNQRVNEAAEGARTALKAAGLKKMRVRSAVTAATSKPAEGPRRSDGASRPESAMPLWLAQRLKNNAGK